MQQFPDPSQIHISPPANLSPMTVPFDEYDNLVAGALVVGLKGTTPHAYMNALKTLDSAKGMTTAQWCDYYRSRSDVIKRCMDEAIRAAPSHDSQSPVGPASVDALRSGSGSISKSMQRHAEGAKVHSSETGSEIRRARHAAASSHKRARTPEISTSASDEHHPSRKRRRQSRGSGRKRKVTLEHKRLMAEWQHSWGAAWEDMIASERWGPFAEEYPIRSPEAWGIAYDRREDDMAQAL
ncbi:unnamed protein product [Peniophora sp. CBMAI 1063]|nr:unnamed protein product [Peniophora sp. CBMAI 1063]